MSASEIEYIEHDGKVLKVNAKASSVSVAIKDAGDCSACPAAKICGTGPRRDDVIDVPVADVSAFHPGQQVVIRGSERLHRKAIMLATVIPSILLVGIMFLVWFLTGDQLAACLGGIGAMLLFFLILFLLRNRMAHEFRFEIVDSKHNA